MDRITIIGMGPVGVSIGLGLKRAEMPDTEVVGADGDKKALTTASEMGAIDQRYSNLREALDGAQFVVVDSSTPDLEELLRAIGPVLADGCVLTDTGTDKVRMMEWAANFLTPQASFVGGRPLPWRALDSMEDADGTVFDGTSYCVIPAETATPEAVKAVVGMVEILGAAPLFIDAQEHDSFTAAVAHVPQLLSAALVNALAGDPGWEEMSRIAGSEFFQMSALAAGDPQSLAESSATNHAVIARSIDSMIAELSTLKEMIGGDSNELRDALVRAWEHRARWIEGAPEGSRAELPTPGESMASMVLGSRLVERYKRFSELRNRPPWKYHGKNSPPT